MFKTLLSYAAAGLSGVVGTFVTGKYGVVAGASSAGAVATAASRILHLAPPPVKK